MVDARFQATAWQMLDTLQLMLNPPAADAVALATQPISLAGAGPRACARFAPTNTALKRIGP